MSLTADMIEALGEEGLNVEAIVRIARKAELRLEAEREEKLATKREGNATRQRRFKSNKKARDNAGNEGNALPDVTPPPNEYISNPPPVTSEIPNGIPSPTDLKIGNGELVEASSADPIQLKPEHVLEAWNDLANRTGLPKAKKLTPERRRKLITRIRQNSIEEFTEAIGTIERSPFLRGENGRGWRADFDWMLEPRNFTKLTEGSYER